MARKKQEEGRPDWELSNIGTTMFTSLMIILLAFFIMLTSMAVVDEQRKMEAMGSVLGAFGILPGGLGTELGQTDQNLSPSTSPMEIIKNDLENIREVLSQRIIGAKFPVLEGRTSRTITLDDALLFEPDGVEILPEMKPVLLEIAAILKNSDYPVIIEGHTDDQKPQTEAFRDNWQVSGLRALNVLRFMVEDGGVDPARLSAYGYAGTRPRVANNSPRNRSINRRIDIVLDQTHRMQAYKMSEKHRRTRSFDYRGFNFRLFGNEGKK